MSKVLVVATSRQTRGGITAVVKAHEYGPQWKNYHCRWIETHIDKNHVIKMFFLMKAFIVYCFLLPFYDIVHIHLSEPVSALRKCPFAFLAHLYRRKLILHFHAFSSASTIYGKRRSIYKSLFYQADCLIVLSESWRKTINDSFNIGDKIHILYNPCTAQIGEDIYEKKNQILYAGTINARKGYADMIKAFSKIALKYSDWKIVFAGNGEIDQGKTLAKSLGIESQTAFLGWLSGEAKDKAFKESRIFCLPSYAEGFPMAVLDAWSYGLPVITTPVGGIPDVAVDNINMMVFNPGDIDALADKMDLMISDVSMRQNIADESRKLAEVTFNIHTINDQLSDIYKQILR